MDRDEASKLANKLVEKLKNDPNHVENREEFARVLAEQLDKPDAAIDQIKLLLDMPEQPDKKRAEWLGTIAAWHLRHRQDRDAARKYLEKLIRQYPQTPQAFAAQKRLNLMEVEWRIEKNRQVKATEPAPKIQIT
jgi:tetratricopeptide (TPR) repeat protein